MNSEPLKTITEKVFKGIKERIGKLGKIRQSEKNTCFMQLMSMEF